MTRRNLIFAIAAVPGISPGQNVSSFPLRLDLLVLSLAALSAEDRRRIDNAIALIRRGEHVAAFAPLLQLSKSNPRSSGVRVVLAYALLQAGNFAGAFEHAKKAETLADKTIGVCLFLARVAAITGNKDICRRELEHISGDPQLRAEAIEIDRQLQDEKRTLR